MDIPSSIDASTMETKDVISQLDIELAAIELVKKGIENIKIPRSLPPQAATDIDMAALSVDKTIRQLQGSRAKLVKRLQALEVEKRQAFEDETLDKAGHAVVKGARDVTHWTGRRFDDVGGWLNAREEEGPARRLPVFEGYTVDLRLKEFRKMEYGKRPETIPFKSPEGDIMLADFVKTREGARLAREGKTRMTLPPEYKELILAGVAGAVSAITYYVISQYLSPGTQQPGPTTAALAEGFGYPDLGDRIF